MNKRQWNWRIWAGFLLCLVGFGTYPFLFVNFPALLRMPWVNFVLLAAGVLLLVVGLRRAYRDAEHYRGKVAGPILGVLSLFMVGFFCYIVFYATRQLPASAGAPRVGQKAPEFALADINNQQVSLASLLSAPLPGTNAVPKGVVLVFYRGYW